MILQGGLGIWPANSAAQRQVSVILENRNNMNPAYSKYLLAADVILLIHFLFVAFSELTFVIVYALFFAFILLTFRVIPPEM